MEEQRQGHIDLQQEFRTHVERFNQFEESVLTVIAGPEDPLTKQRTGGMRAEQGRMLLAIERFEYRAANGGINTKWSFWQKMSIATIGPVSVGLFAWLQTLTDNPGQ